jgi:5'-nucleotidase
MQPRPLILLSNDDGFRAPGLLQAKLALTEIADVVVCAPHSEQSGTSHSISLTTPLRLREHEPGVFSVDGTPADSVYVALCSHGRVLPRRPDLVVSGINHGLNLAGDVFYSGTVAAAREATQQTSAPPRAARSVSLAPSWPSHCPNPTLGCC